MSQEKAQTPLMKQYWEIKSLHLDKIVLFRMGDFFEMFFDDAIKAAPILGIALTSRNKKAQDETPMCGMPHHSIAGGINKLLAQGFKVAICDQIEDPKFAKGIVKRAVTRVLTPGMIYDSDTIEPTKPHYLACYEDQCLACLDLTTSEAFYFAEITEAQANSLLAVMPIAELVRSSEAQVSFAGTISIHDELSVQLLDQPKAVRRLYAYVLSTATQDQVSLIQKFEQRKIIGRLHLSSTTLKHLEIFQSFKGGNNDTLFGVVNRTKTSAGARLLRTHLAFPLTDQAEIEKRLDKLQHWITHLACLKQVRERLGLMGDIERRLGKIAQPQCHARDLLALAESIEQGLLAIKIAEEQGLLNFADAEPVKKLAQEVLSSLVEDPPLTTRQGHMIRKGVNPQLDELITLSTDSHSLLAEMETKEKERTGISSLKIRYNNVFGYYIEVTHTHKDKVPSNYLRKQTLANAERYCTDELVELEKKVLSAQAKRYDLEYEIFTELRKQVLQQSSQLLAFAQIISDLDVVTSNAWLAIERNYCRPEFIQAGLQVENLRHPVVEVTMQGKFVPNSLHLDAGSCLLLTGPNMAGKSTLMRQVALSVILAQAGIFVPAKKAQIQIFDSIFTRIGASDILAEGLSTFMVEMTETSEMLRQATSRSLLILDEVGRGTSTFDGMSLAQAILEYISTHVHAMTLFATHYHELTKLSEELKNVHNAHMGILEQRGEIKFLHTLLQGPAQKSYGVHVAKLAGLPKEVIQRAQSLLKQHETQKSQEQMSLLEFQPSEPPQSHPVLEDIRNVEIMQMTPLEAMSRILGWQKEINQ